MTRILAVLSLLLLLAFLATRRREEVARPDAPCPRCGEWCGVTWPPDDGWGIGV